MGKDTHQLTGMEKIFYEDQCANRAHLLSQDIDTEYGEEQQRLWDQQNLEEEQHQSEMDFVNEEADVVTDPTPRNQRGTVSSKTTMVDKEIQIDFPSPPPAIRIVYCI